MNVKSEFFLIHIVDVVFLIRKVTFLEKFNELCSLFSYLMDVMMYCAKIYYSIVILLVIVCFQYLVVFFPREFPVFLRRFTGMYGVPSLID